MDVYSTTLAVGLAAAFGSLALVVAGRLGASRGGGPAGIRRVAVVASVAAAVLLAFAGTFHVTFGHRPRSATGLGPIAFVAEHPALFVGATAAVVAALMLRVGAHD